VSREQQDRKVQQDQQAQQVLFHPLGQTMETTYIGIQIRYQQHRQSVGQILILEVLQDKQIRKQTQLRLVIRLDKQIKELKPSQLDTKQVHHFKEQMH
jgi:hypothetical protein